MSVLVLILLIASFLLLLGRAAGITHPRVELTALGLALYVLSVIAAGTKLP